MPTEIGRGIIGLGFDAAQLEGDAKKNVLPVVKRAAEDAALLWGATKIIQIGKEGLDELKQAQEVMAVTEAHIKSTGGAAGVTAGHVQDLAGSLMHVSGVDDEVIQGGENMLLTFKAVANQAGEGNDIFDQATVAALDLSKSGFGSMESASVMLGKALNDPVKGMTALGRAGVTFTEDQKEAIKSLSESGDLLGAQKIILGEVEAQVGGTAAAYGETLPGKIDIAHESLNNLKGQLVAGSAPALSLVADTATALSDKFQELPESAQTAIGGVVLLGGAVGTIARPVGDVVNLFRLLKPAQEAAAVATTADTIATEANTVAQEANAVASAGAGTQAMGLVTKLGALGAAVGLAAAAWYGLEHATSINVDIQKVSGASTADLVKTFTDLGAKSGISTGLQEMFGKVMEGNIGTARRLRDGLAEQGVDVSKLDEMLKKEAESQKQATSDMQAGAGAAEGLGGTTETAARSVDELRASSDELTDAEKALVESADAAAKAHDDFGGFMEELAGSFKKTHDSMFAAVDATNSYESANNDLIDTLKTEGFTLDTASIAGGKYNEHALKNIDALQKMSDAVITAAQNRFAETHSVEEATTAASTYTDQLKEQLKEAGYNDEQIGQMIETMHLTPEDIKTTFANNAVEQQLVVGKYLQELDKIDAPHQTMIEALINQGKYDEANQALADLAVGRTVDLTVQVHANGQILTTDRTTGEVTSEIDITARNVNRFAEGGLVPGPRGQAQLAVVHGGEFVVSADEVEAAQRSGGITGPYSGDVHNYTVVVSAELKDPYGTGSEVVRGIRDEVARV